MLNDFGFAVDFDPTVKHSFVGHFCYAPTAFLVAYDRGERTFAYCPQTDLESVVKIFILSRPNAPLAQSCRTATSALKAWAEWEVSAGEKDTLSLLLRLLVMTRTTELATLHQSLSVALKRV